jgi:hypothetical protein
MMFIYKFMDCLVRLISVFCQNIVSGHAPPFAAGIDDCCLSGLCLATPVLLAYM